MAEFFFPHFENLMDLQHKKTQFQLQKPQKITTFHKTHIKKKNQTKNQYPIKKSNLPGKSNLVTVCNFQPWP